MDKKVFILRDASIRDRSIVYQNKLPIDAKKPYKVTYELYKKNRSLAQNNLMWKWLAELSQHLRNEYGLDSTPDDLKHEFQKRHLGRRFYEMPNEDLGQRIVGTSELNTAQFTEFLNEIEVYAANVGLQLPHPEDLYYEAMQGEKHGPR